MCAWQDPALAEPDHADQATCGLQWRAGALYAAALLQELVRDPHSQTLQAWAMAAPAMQSAVAEALALTDNTTSSQGAEVLPRHVTSHP